jgi:hypothetical protein
VTPLFRLAALVCALGFGAPTYAQQITTGTITGIAADPQRLPLRGAAVSLSSEDANDVRRTITNDAGVFVIRALPPGHYTLFVSAEGLQSTELRAIRLRANEVYDAGHVLLGLQPLTATTAAVAEVAVLQTAAADRSAIVESEQIHSLLARGRDPMSLLNALPGVAPVTEVTSLGGQIGPLTPNISGHRSASAGLAVDGMASSDVDNGRHTSPVSLEAVDQIEVRLNNYAAEHGRNTGAHVNLVTKSGTHEFKGSLAYYLRHEALNANNFLNIRNGLEKPLYRYNTLSGTLGGPVIVPGVFGGSRDRLFFFYVREMWDADEPRAPRFATMPSALERAGDFSQSFDQNGRLIPVIDPATGVPFPGNRIPHDRVNPNGRAILDLLPLPNFFDTAVSRGAYNYRDQDIASIEKTLDQVRLDVNLSERDRLWVRARRWRPVTEAYSGVAAIASNWNQFRHGYGQRENSIQATHTRILGTTIVNEFSGSFREMQEVGPTIDTLDAVTRAHTGLRHLRQLYPAANPRDVVPAATFGGVPGTAPTIAFDGRFPIDGRDVRWVAADNVSWAAGGHLLKGGVYFEYNRNSEGPGPITTCFSGCFNFGADRNSPLDTGYAFANALLGSFTSYQEATSRPLSAGRSHFVEGFVQDSWKPRTNLTLDFGVRLSWGIPWRLLDGQSGGAFVREAWDPARQPRLFTPALVNGRRVGVDPVTGQVVAAALVGAIVPGSGDPFNGIITEDDPLGRAGWRDTPPVQPQPRVGFAWDPRSDGRTAVRGGFAITTQVLQDSGDFSLRIPAAPPARLQPTILYGNIDALDASEGYLFPLDAVPAYSRDYRPPTTRSFFLELQQQVGFDTVVSAAYVGNRQRNLIQSRNLNALPAGSRFDPANADPTNPSRPLPDAFLTPITGFGTIRNIENTGFADYDALQITAARRFKDGLQYGAAYTLSRSRNLTDGDGGTLPTYRDPREFLWDYAGYDRRHVLTVNYVWDLPAGSQLWNMAIARAVLDGWQIAGVAQFATGVPAEVTFTTTDNADIVGGLCAAGSATCGDANRIVVTGDPTLANPSFDRWFDTSVFARPARGDAGNAPRQVIRLPGRHNWDVTVSKIVAGRQGRGVQLRAEVYNLFNSRQWTMVETVARFDPQGRQVNARFGQVTAAADPRIVQLSLRAMF